MPDSDGKLDTHQKSLKFFDSEADGFDGGMSAQARARGNVDHV